MAITFDSASMYNGGGSASSRTLSHTTSGTDRGLLVQIWTGSAVTISSITYNSVAMTQVGSTLSSASERYFLFKLENPSSGTNNVSVTFSGNNNQVLQVMSFTGVDQTNMIDSSGGAVTAGSTSPLVQSVTSTVDEAMGYWFPREYTGKTVTGATGTTIVSADTTQAGTRACHSTSPFGSAGSYNMQVDFSAGTPGHWTGFYGTLAPAPSTNSGNFFAVM